MAMNAQAPQAKEVMKDSKMFLRRVRIGELLEFEIEFFNNFYLVVYPEGDVHLGEWVTPTECDYFAEGRIVGDLEDIKWHTCRREIPPEMHSSIISELRSALEFPVGKLWLEQVWANQVWAKARNQTEAANGTAAGTENLDG